MWTIYWQSYKLGYEKGSDAIVAIMESGLINQLILGASIMGCLVLGGLVGNYVTLGLKLMVLWAEASCSISRNSCLT